MAPRKKARMGKAGPSSSAAPGTPLTPSQALTTSQDAAAEPPAPATSPASQSRQTSGAGMAPPPLPQAGSSKKSDGSNKAAELGKQVVEKRSWYGSLSRKSAPSQKSTPSTSIHKETIVTGSPLKAGSTPDLHRYDLKRTDDNASFSGASSASVNAPSKLHETMPGDTQASSTEPAGPESSGNDVNTKQAPAEAPGSKDAAGATSDTPMPDAPPVADTTERSTTSPGWGLGGWFGRTPTRAEKPTQEIQQPPLEPAKEAEPEPSAQESTTPVSDEQTSTTTLTQRAASWLWPYPTTATDESGESTEAVESTAADNAENTPIHDAPPVAAPEPTPKPSAGSTWAFWSKDTPKSAGHKPQPSETGELAVIGEGSERHPKRANSMDMNQEPPAKAKANIPKEPPLQAGKEKGKKPKRNRPQSMDLDDIPSRPQTPKQDTASIKTGSPKTQTKTPTSAVKTGGLDLLLPSFKGTYRMKDNPSIMKQIAALLLRTQQSTPKHVFLTKDPPKIKKAVAIGVHGLFPAAYLRPVIGQPTGTSVKFAQHAADAIRRWANSHGCEDEDLVIEKAALEGDGKILDRVTNLWNLLQNWMDHIREADFILFACHSQGVPVSIMLLQKLIESGAVNRAKIGVCAMAGVNLGPFPEYKPGMGMFMGSAAELWEFADPKSNVSKRYEAALKQVLYHGVRITYIGSIDDQLVPVESAIYSPASHPYLYRAIFIDARLRAPDFISHLVGFACKLRNLGVSDHGLIRELSVPLAGSLYGGEGHSRLYDDEQVYDLAITHALETTNVGAVPCTVTRHDGPATPNPYHLPWIMRGLLEEDFVKTELSAETDALLRQFDEWKPTTKPLKDVKFRLDAVRSRL